MLKKLFGRLFGSSERTPEVDPQQWQSIVAEIEQRGMPCARLITSGKDGSTLTKIGGRPNMSGRFDWPELDGQPMAFIAQIELAELQRAEKIDWLPAVGRLLFFYDAEQRAWGFDPKDKDHWAVCFDPAAEPAATADIPTGLAAGDRLGELHLEIVPGRSYPSLERLGEVVGDVPDAVWDKIDEHFAPKQPAHQIGGFASPVQNDDMELECQLASNGIYVGDPSGYSSPQSAALKAGRTDWQLLLQIDSDDDANAMWGDTGMLYFWIRRQDAEKQDFSKVWMVLQCC